MIAAPSTPMPHPGPRASDAQLAHFPPVEASEFREALRNLASGVAIVATGVGEARRGLTASSVTSICADPPCLLVSVNTKSEAHDSILANGYFGISLLRTGQEALARHFAGLDGVGGADRLQECAVERGRNRRAIAGYGDMRHRLRAAAAPDCRQPRHLHRADRCDPTTRCRQSRDQFPGRASHAAPDR